MEITILPKSQRAKNRIKEHGSKMILIKELKNKILVQSIEKTWRNQFWLGWFDNEEADFLNN